MGDLVPFDKNRLTPRQKQFIAGVAAFLAALPFIYGVIGS